MHLDGLSNRGKVLAMPELSFQNIDRISSDISRQEIYFSHLLDELIDHVCCDVENEMNEGLSFEEAYKRVKKKIGTGRIKEIQEETLFAVDTKYRKMKNFMKISGVAGTVMFGFAAILKIEHLPGAGILMTLGAFMLAFLFLPSAMTVLWKESHSSKRLFLFISGFLAGMLFILGTLFKIQHWPSAGWILAFAAVSGILFFVPALFAERMAEQPDKAKKPVYIIGAAGTICFAAGMFFKMQHWPAATLLMALGLILLGLVAFPWYTWLTWKEEQHINSKFLFMVIASVAIAAPCGLLNLNLQRNYNIGYYIHEGQQQNLNKTLQVRIQSYMYQYRDSDTYPVMKELHTRTGKLLDLIAGIQVKMVAESEGRPGVPALGPKQITSTETGPVIDYNLLSKPLVTDPVKDFLLPECSSRKELTAAAEEYKNAMSEMMKGKDIEAYKGLLDPAVFLPGDDNKGSGISLLSGLHSLELMKNSLLTFETYMLSSLVNN
jgi:hypothetical protein